MIIARIKIDTVINMYRQVDTWIIKVCTIIDLIVEYIILYIHAYIFCKYYRLSGVYCDFLV